MYRRRLNEAVPPHVVLFESLRPDAGARPVSYIVHPCPLCRRFIQRPQSAPVPYGATRAQIEVADDCSHRLPQMDDLDLARITTRVCIPVSRFSMATTTVCSGGCCFLARTFMRWSRLLACASSTLCCEVSGVPHTLQATTLAQPPVEHQGLGCRATGTPPSRLAAWPWSCSCPLGSCRKTQAAEQRRSSGDVYVYEAWSCIVAAAQKLLHTTLRAQTHPGGTGTPSTRCT